MIAGWEKQQREKWGKYITENKRIIVNCDIFVDLLNGVHIECLDI